MMHEPRIALTKDEIETVSAIIGRLYTSGFIVRHRFYDGWGTSVLFTTSDRQYSEGSAGSGEAAVARIVHEVYCSKPGRLLLLDEPETSLHPGAQERLLMFLLKKVSEKSLQVLISTHSPAFVRNLPKEAIQVFSLNTENRVQVTPNVSADEAFYVLGHPLESQHHLIVEDRLSKTILDAVLETMDKPFAAKFITDFQPGGEKAMKQDAASRSQENDNRKCFIFDGDTKASTTGVDTNSIAFDADYEQLDEFIKKSFGIAVKFREDSNMDTNKKTLIRRNFINYAKKHFYCLPYETPEDAVWNGDVARKTLEAWSVDPKIVDNMEKLKSAKEKYAAFAVAASPAGSPPVGNDISTFHKAFVLSFIRNSSHVQIAAIKTLLKEIANA